MWVYFTITGAQLCRYSIDLSETNTGFNFSRGVYSDACSWEYVIFCLPQLDRLFLLFVNNWAKLTLQAIQLGRGSSYSLSTVPVVQWNGVEVCDRLGSDLLGWINTLKERMGGESLGSSTQVANAQWHKCVCSELLAIGIANHLYLLRTAWDLCLTPRRTK